MKPFSVFSLILLPFLVSVQAQSPILSTSLTTYVTLGSGRVETTVTSGVVFTSTPSSQQPTVTPGQNSGTLSGSGSRSLPPNSGASNATSSSLTSTSSTPLPTAPTGSGQVPGGGSGGANGGAPAPGQTGAGGIYGPDDSYRSGSMKMSADVLMGSVVVALVGGLVFA